MSTKENELGESPKNWGGMRHWYSEGFYELFKAQTLIETFPNCNQIYFKYCEIKHNLKFELKKRKGECPLDFISSRFTVL